MVKKYSEYTVAAERMHTTKEMGIGMVVYAWLAVLATYFVGIVWGISIVIVLTGIFLEQLWLMQTTVADLE